jgi:oligoendopeptidase F
MRYKLAAWNLKDLVPDRNKLPQMLKLLETRLKRVERHKKFFKPTMPTKWFKTLIDDLESYDKLAGTLGQYAYLCFSQDTKNKEAITFRSKIQKIGSEHSNRLLWFKLEFVKFPKQHTKRLIKAVPKADYFLKMVLKEKDFVLSDKEEKIITMKDATGASKLDNIYNLLTSDFLYDFEGKKITQEELVTKVHNSSAVVRKKAYTALFVPYKKFENILGEIYTATITDWYKENVEVRGYKTPITVRNKDNDIDDKAIKTLMRVAEKNQKVFHQYFKLKAKAIGTKKLSRFDLYAPLEKTKETISYPDATELVLKAFKGFSSEFYELAKSMFTQKHVHSLVYKGKMGGAYNYGVDPEYKPYVMLTYTGDARSVSTLAHELGHAIHFMLSSKKNSIFHVGSALPIAETASIFSELLLAEALKQEKPHLRRSLLFDQLDNAYASISRQLHFIAFEIKAHDAARDHVSTEWLHATYYKMLQQHFGSGVVVPEAFKHEWSYIPHIFHTPFYCYAYGFGNLLSFAAYAQYKDQGSSYSKNVIRMLSDGGSKSPRVLVKELGFDIASARFWQKGFDVIKDMVKELNRL